MLQWYRQLIAVRHKFSDLSNGHMSQITARFDEQAQWLAVRRGRFGIICNFAQRRQAVPLEPQQHRQVFLSSEPDISIEGENLHLPPDSIVVLGPPAG
jgi:maltooligosyltrehalose trehalohydrolase